MGFVFVQCRDDACRLRFPAEAAAVESGLVCPRCRNKTLALTLSPREREPETLSPREWGLEGASRPAEGRDDRPAATGAAGVRLVALLDNIRSIHNM